MKFHSNIDKKTSDEIEALQGGLLKEIVEYVNTHSAYYKVALNKANVSSEDIRGISDIKLLPITSKEDIQKDNWGFLCVHRNKIAELVSTSGTTGAPIFFAMTANDIERLADNERRCFSLTGVGSSDLFQITVTLDNLFIAGMAYYRGLLKIGAGVVRVGPCSPQRQMELIRTLKPTGIVAVPSFMLAIYKEAEKEGIKLDTFSLKKAVLIGESIKNTDFSSNTLGKMLINKNSTIEYYSTYGVTEAAIAFCECHYHQGFHSHPDLIFAEVLDIEGKEVKEGEIGELVLTSFKVEGMPLIRYRTGDMTFKINGKCNCGRRSPRIGPIIGRKAQKLKLKGTTVYPKAIESVLLEIEEIVCYIIEAYTGEDQADHVIVKVGSKTKSNTLAETICRKIKEKIRVTPEVEVLLPKVIEKQLYEGGRRKPKIFVDKRQKLL